MANAPSSTEHNRELPRRGNSRRKWYLLGLAAVFVLIGAAYAAYYFMVAQFYAQTDDAYVHGNRVMLAPQRAGTVTAIYADDTDRVRAGDTVIELDDTDVDNALESASAGLAQAVRHVHQLFAQTDEQRATVDMRETQLEQARRDYDRDQQLLKVNGVTRKAFEHSRSDFQQARAALSAARHRLTELEAQTHGTTLRGHPAVREAAAKLRDAYLDVRRSRVPAPVDGYVAQRDVQLGQRVDPGKPMLSIVPIDQAWVNANFKETQLAAMRIGQPATVYSDFYGDETIYHGHVAGISPGTGAAFELLPPQNASGNWIKIVRRVPVRIVLDGDDLKHHPLRLGLSMHVSVDLHDTSGQPLAEAAREKARLRTDVYRQRDDGAAQIIDRIIAVNDGDPSTTARAPAHTIGRLTTSP
ncbi:Putative multidrug resistance protein [Salinisphaera shabanensis E1L3A]|uniref:Multidrug resistance protein n=1 Tax=Salinisphaera shabanensis E1L3A TaxID=1033802 RepID=U2FTN4_9GAMM|nr:efflux RND transporter periplasmic adaptor subunit [Salinisphaera shabanensis]ERJ19339.1 Putative multidrug resistance protein [Salinisphaera shabanensis E1L3A]